MLSLKVTESLNPYKVDHRRPLDQWEIDVAQELDSLTKNVSEIPTLLAEQIRPRFEAYNDQERTQAKLEQAKKALYSA